MKLYLSLSALVTAAASIGLSPSSSSSATLSGVIRIDGVNIPTSYLSTVMGYDALTTTTNITEALVVNLNASCSATDTTLINILAPGLGDYPYLGACSLGKEPSLLPSGALEFVQGLKGISSAVSSSVTCADKSDYVGESQIWSLNCATGLLSATWTNQAKTRVPLQSVLISVPGAFILTLTQTGNAASMVASNPIATVSTYVVLVTLTFVATK